MFALTRNEIVQGDSARKVSRKPIQGLLPPLGGDQGTTVVEKKLSTCFPAWNETKRLNITPQSDMHD
jgi:hypothetical protein